MSRTDSIGDVVLTLPMAGYIKKHFPGAYIGFLGRSYTKDVIDLSEHIDEFINYDEFEKLNSDEQVKKLNEFKADVFIHVFPKSEIAWLAKRSGIKYTVGTSHRFYHWFTCNEKIKFSRKNSPLHESQLNFKLLKFFGFSVDLSTEEIAKYYGFTKIPSLSDENRDLLDPNRKNIILHPKSKGSAKEWGLNNFSELISKLPSEKFKIFISGTKEDGEKLNEIFQKHPEAINLAGKFTLKEFIAFISQSQALVAASTGPLHIAAALGIKAIGLFSPRRPIHPGRWKPLGKDAHYLVFEDDCVACKKSKHCDCIQKINPQLIVDLLEQ